VRADPVDRLADGQKLLGAGSRVDEARERRRAAQHRSGDGAAGLRADPVVERLRRVDGQRPQPLGDLDLAALTVPIKGIREARCAAELAHERTASAGRGGEPEHRGDRRLPGAALSADVHQRALEHRAGRGASDRLGGSGEHGARLRRRRPRAIRASCGFPCVRVTDGGPAAGA